DGTALGVYSRSADADRSNRQQRQRQIANGLADCHGQALRQLGIRRAWVIDRCVDGAIVRIAAAIALEGRQQAVLARSQREDAKLTEIVRRRAADVCEAATSVVVELVPHC